MPNGLYLLLDRFDNHPKPIFWREDLTEFLDTKQQIRPQDWLLPKGTQLTVCSWCQEGVISGVGESLICQNCLSRFSASEFLTWEGSREVFLGWITTRLGFDPQYHFFGQSLILLGKRASSKETEWLFYQLPKPRSPLEENRLRASQSTWVLFGTEAPSSSPTPVRAVSLLDLLWVENGEWHVRPLPKSQGKAVRFDIQSGTLWVGPEAIGQVRYQSREYHFLRILSEAPDRFCTYEELKALILQATRTKDERDAATYCHRLKHTIKQRILRIDSVLQSSGQGEGYCLRSRV